MIALSIASVTTPGGIAPRFTDLAPMVMFRVHYHLRARIRQAILKFTGPFASVSIVFACFDCVFDWENV